MKEEEIREIAKHYGELCSFEKLVISGTTEHNGLRYENIIPWTTKTDVWVKQETRITASTLEILESCQVRNFKILFTHA